MLKSINKTLLLAGAALMLLACQEQNPLLGEWALDKSSDVKPYDLKMAEVAGNGKIKFEQDRMVSGTHARAVSYSVSGNTVTVRYIESGDSNSYDIVDGRAFSFYIPEVGTFIYTRIGKAPNL